MMHALLWICLLLPPQSAEPSVPPDAVPLVQSGMDAENRGALDQAVAQLKAESDSRSIRQVAAAVTDNTMDSHGEQHSY